MTDHDAMTPQIDTPIDKLFEHHRQQLSAMLDGELPPDQAKFMLRRLEHDGELATCWERWQVCGDILRGRHDALLPADFSQRVALAISAGEASGTVATPVVPGNSHRQPKWLRWGGGAALAASVAMIAVLVTRQVPDLGSPASTQPVTVATSSMATPDTSPLDPAAAGIAPDSSPSPSTPAPELATTLATAVAVAQLPRRASERRSRGQSQRAALRVRQQADMPMLATANLASPKSPMANAPTQLAAVTGVTGAGSHEVDPFVTQSVPASRPWPRAILPSFPANTAFTASYGSAGESASAHPFHPFEPRVELQSAPDAGQRSSGPR